MPPLYELDGVTKRYGDTTALRDLTLRIDDAVTGVIGYSGSGKTTLLRLLAGLELPTRGTLRYRGTPVTPRTARALRRDVTMLFQEPLFFDQRVVDNVAYGLRRRGVAKTEATRRATQALPPLGLDGYAERHAARLSGGEQQRVALARALVLEPKVLLLDEPTSDLDPTNTRVIVDLVKAFAATAPVVIASHDFAHVVELAERVAVLIDGALMQYDAPFKIFYQPPNEAVARFVGVENLFQGTVVAHDAGLATVAVDGQTIQVSSSLDRGAVSVFVRPENVILSPRRLTSSARNNLHGRIAKIVQIGPVFRVTLDNGVHAFITRQSLDELALRVGTPVYAAFKATAAHLVARDAAD
jgi:molybdopterin-binding protein